MSDILSSLYAQGVAASNITADSRQVGPGSLFLAYAGERLDGREFIAQAIQQGAAAVAWESKDFHFNRKACRSRRFGPGHSCSGRTYFCTQKPQGILWLII